jgi:nucleotide-binding universal stress UspA family protein
MKILLATDGSQYSEAAAGFLTRFNWSEHDEITLFHAIHLSLSGYDKEFCSNALKIVKAGVGFRILDSALEILKDLKARTATAITEGSPEQCICDAAAVSDIDIIAMGGRGLKGIKSFLIGSTTRSVAHNSSKSVLIIKPQAPAKRDKMKVLFAVDGSEYSRAAGEFLSSMPFIGETELTILNVIWSNFFDIPDRFAIEIDERAKESVERARTIEFNQSGKIVDEARGYLGRTFKKILVDSKTGDPSTEILKKAEEMDADIITMGCRGLRGIKGMLGSVSRNVLAHSKSSVLIGKARNM